MPDYLIEEAKKELARRYLYEYCKLLHPNFYKPSRKYLEDLCNSIQEFLNQDEDRFLIVEMPPRHGKSYTAKNTTEWLFGENNKLKVMTGSYNETLSGMFAKQVRDTIATLKIGEQVVYNDIFPNTKIKHGEASASMWALEENKEKNYLATSPTGTATGFGATILIIDDLIKNAEEAYNENVLDKHWEWFTNTMLSRLEGNWKVIVFMTRWAEKDISGRIKANYKNVRTITFKALQEDGIMLCEEILNKEDFILKTQEMNDDIVQANYQQTPIDVKGKLYGEFKIWEELPKFTKKYNITDTADEGSDYLCSIDFIEYNNEAYITDIVFTDEKMEITEELVTDMLYKDEVNESEIESNNGGRGFARNVQRRLLEKYKSNKTVIIPKRQTKNKESRILSSSAWIEKHIYMPFNWKNKYPAFYKNVTSYMKKGKNAHDDGPDVLASIYEKLAVRQDWGWR